ncbi:MAG: glycosyltransferase 87 family protein, partial [Desulfobaccales bacterium]
MVETAFLGGSFKGYMACHLAPSFLLTVLPISFIPYLVALCAWLAIPLCGLIVIVSKIAPYPITVRLTLAFPAIASNLFYGQGAFLITFLMGAGLLLLDSCPIISGILFSLIINYKPHLGLL